VKYAPSALIGRLSRSAGSTTASHNRFGSYLRNRVIPTNPLTAKQTAVRVQLAAVSSAWKTLSQANRDGWTALGTQITKTDSLGSSYTLNGLQAFVSCNRNRLTAGVSILSVAPAIPTITAFATATFTSAAGALTFTFTATPLGATDQLFISLTPGVSAGINFMPRGRYKLATVTALNVASPIALLAAYTALYGVPVAGQKVFLSALRHNQASGFVGPPTILTVIAT